MPDYDPVSPDEFARLEGLRQWRYDDTAIRAELHAGSFSAAGALASRIATQADAADHHPDLAIRYPDVVEVTLSTHFKGGVTTADVELARAVTKLAAEAEATFASAGES